MSPYLLPAILVLAGVVLAVLSWPGLVDDLFRRVRKNREEGEDLAADFADDLGDYVSAPSAARLRPGPSRDLVDEARPVEPDSADRKRLAALYAFLDGLDAALDRDDPDVWPDDTKGAKDLADAAAILHRAELRAERSAPFIDGGHAAAMLCEKGVDALAKAGQRGADAGGVRLGLARAAWIRSRARKHRYHREGIRAAMRMANEARAQEPRPEGADGFVARCQVALGRLDPARVTLVKALGAKPDDPETLRTRSRWLFAHGDERGASDAVDDILDKLPDALAMAERVRVAPMFEHQGRWKTAEELWDALLGWDEAMHEAWAGKARCRLDGRDWQGAADAAKRSIELEPSAEARDALRRAMVESGGEAS
jgi:tetratricopeptide (TPR) repeat protein